MPDPLGVGVLGYGFMAAAHLAGLRAVAGARVVAIAGPNRVRASQVAAAHDVPAVYASADELAADPAVDAVVVASPDDQHYPQTMTAIAAGAHVFVEKPVARTAAQARQMHAAAVQAGLRTGVGFTLRWNPLVERIHAMVQAGELGRVVSVHAQRFNKRLLGQAPPTMEWRYDPARCGSGALGDLGSHMIDLAQHLAGPITEVAADLAAVRTHARDPASGAEVPLTLDDDAVLSVRFASGAHGTISSSRVGMVDSHLPLGRSSFLINGTRAGVLTDGVLHASIHQLGRDPRPLDPGLPLDDADHAGILAFFGERMMRGFVEAVRSGRDVPPTLADGLRAQEVVDAALTAARERRWVEVPAAHETFATPGLPANAGTQEA